LTTLLFGKKRPALGKNAGVVCESLKGVSGSANKSILGRKRDAGLATDVIQPGRGGRDRLPLISDDSRSKDITLTNKRKRGKSEKETERAIRGGGRGDYSLGRKPRRKIGGKKGKD